jgi:predicted membrane protein
MVRKMRINSQKLIGWIILIIGLLFLLENILPEFNAWHFIGNLWPLILIFIGLYITVNWRRFSREASGEDWETRSRFVGELKTSYSGQEIGDISVSLFVGELSIDLAGARLLTGENRLNASFGIGEATIYVPIGFPLRVTARAFAGELKYDRHKSGGIFPKLEQIDDDYQSSEKKLHINVDGFIGELTIQKIGDIDDSGE